MCLNFLAHEKHNATTMCETGSMLPATHSSWLAVWLFPPPPPSALGLRERGRGSLQSNARQPPSQTEESSLVGKQRQLPHPESKCRIPAL